MKKTNKKKILAIILVGCLIIIGIFGILYFRPKEEVEIPVIDDTEEKIEDTITYSDEYYRNFYKSQKEINEDYVGQIFFQSGLITEPFVQGDSNFTYLRTDWVSGEYDVEGSNFMDYENTLDDQNIVIYGHYVFESLDPTLTHKFTPLEKLLTSDNYEDNKTIYLLLEDEIREYEIASVSYIELVKDGDYYYTNEDEQYYLTNFSKDYFETYHYRIKQLEQYKTGLDFTFGDKLLTLQTCTRSREDLREIVIAVLKDTYKLDGKCTLPEYQLTK